MGSKPSDFLIGVGEFIGILLPGSAVAYLALPTIRKIAATYELPALQGSVGWMAVAVIAYRPDT